MPSLSPLPLLLVTACLPELPDDPKVDTATDTATDTADTGPAGSPPVVSNVRLEPAEPRTDDVLRVAYDAEDPDGDTLYTAIAWSVNGVVVEGQTGDELEGAVWFDRDDVVGVTVSVSDGSLAGEGSAQGTVANSAPSAPAVTITPSDPTDDDALTCAVATDSVDPDGDAVTYVYSWTVDGADAGVTVARVDAARTSAGETWTCSVTATDGTDTSDAGSVTVAVRAAQVLVVAGSDGHISATSDGATWAAWSSPTTNDLTAMECGGGVCLVVDTSGNAWRTEDDGGSWTRAPLPDLTGARTGYPAEFGALPINLRYLSGRWFLAGRARIYVSDDAMGWRMTYDNPSLVNGYGHELQLRGFGRVGDDVIVGSGGEGYVYTLLSNDAGETWPTVTQASSGTMPGVGGNCSNLFAMDDGASFWTAGWSYCDGNPYSTFDIWSSSVTASLSWTSRTPAGVFEQGMGVGSDGEGTAIFVGSSSSNPAHTCDGWALVAGGVVTTGRIGVADSTCTYPTSSGLPRLVAFGGEWYMPASGLGTGTLLVASWDATSWRAVDPGFEAAAVVRLE